MENIAKRKTQQKERKNESKKKKRQEQKRRNLLQEETKQVKFLLRNYLSDSGSWDKLYQTYARKNSRIFFQNPYGLFKRNKENKNKGDGLLDEGTLHQFKSLNVDIVCLAKNNVNWNNPHIKTLGTYGQNNTEKRENMPSTNWWWGSIYNKGLWG